MTDSMPSDYDAWVAGTLGVDPSGYDNSSQGGPSATQDPPPAASTPPDITPLPATANARPADTAPAAQGAPGAGATAPGGAPPVNVIIPPSNDAPAKATPAAAPATKSLPFSKAIPLPAWTPKIAGGRIELKVGISLQVTGKISVSDSTTEIDQDALGKAALQMATTWFDSLAKPEVEGKLFDKLEVKREGLGITASAETATSIGTFTFKADLAKIDHTLNKDASLKIELKVANASATYVGKQTPMKNMDIWGLDITGVTIAPTGTVEIAPDWFEIIAKWVEDKGGDAVKKYAEDGVVTVGGDIVIAGSIIVGGVAEIAGACYAIAMAWGIADLSNSYKPNIAASQEGFRTAMKGGQQPTEKFGQAGYAAGQKNYLAIMDATRKANPGASDDGIKAAIAAKADDALKQVSNAIDSAVRRGMWAGYLGQHTSVLTYDDARYAFVACFGYDQKFENQGYNDEWPAYVQQHPKMAALGM